MQNDKVTGTITIRGLFRDKYFLRGYADVVRNRGWDKEYDKWYTGCQWQYERGRHYATATGGKLPPKVQDRSGKTVLNRDGMWVFGDLYNTNEIL